MFVLPGAQAIISQGYSHSNDYYSVAYDGEGDAVVRARLVIDNSGKKDISAFAFEFPSRSIVFYDVFSETKSGKTCLRYKTEPYCTEYDNYYNCLNYEEREECDYWSTGPNYVRVENLTETKTSDATVLAMQLPNPIQVGDSGAITIVYKLAKNAEKSAGLYKFEFKTIIDPSAKLVDNVRVAINVDSGLYLKGTGSNVNYQKEFFGISEAKGLSDKLEASPAYYEEFSRKISYSGQYVKTASNLDPWESFSVEGKYANSYLRAHLGSLVVFSMLGLLVIAGIIFGVKSLVKNMNKQKGSIVGLMIGVSATQAIVLSLLWVLASFVLSQIKNLFYYPMETTFVFAVGTVFALLYLLIFFGPAIVLGVKRGVVAGVVTPILTIMWLLVIMFIVLIFKLIGGLFIRPIINFY